MSVEIKIYDIRYFKIYFIAIISLFEISHLGIFLYSVIVYQKKCSYNVCFVISDRDVFKTISHPVTKITNNILFSSRMLIDFL